MTYNVTYDVNSSILPRTYVDKIHEAVFNTIEEIKPENIVWFEMFEEDFKSEIADRSVYGLIQVVEEATKNETKPTYTAHYIHCGINVVDRDNIHHLNCRLLSSTRFGMGRIMMASQMFDVHERRLALVF